MAKSTKKQKGTIKVKHATKALTPTLQESNRYIAFKIIIDDTEKNKNNINAKDLSKNLYQEIERLMGTIEYSKSSTLFMQELYDQDNMIGIIKTNSGYEDHVKASFCYIKKINDTEIIIKSITTSGSLKKAKEKLEEFNEKIKNNKCC